MCRKAFVVQASVPKVVEKQEVAPVHYNELFEIKVANLNNSPAFIAIHLEDHGVVMAISNEADAVIIRATLSGSSNCVK